MRTKHYNSSEVAAIIGCPVSVVYQALKDGQLKGHKHKTGKWLIPMDQAEAFEEIRQSISIVKENKAPFIQYIADEAHYNDVFQRINEAKSSLQLTCANLKNFSVYLADEEPVPFSVFLLSLLRRGVGVKIVCMDPFPFYRYVSEHLPELFDEPGLELRQNDHVHMKVFIIDRQCAYIGSANLTGAAIGRRSSKQRNYEAGVLVGNNDIFNSAVSHFNTVWDAPETIKSTWNRFKKKSNGQRI
jgi:phosphatidylserine/phosphatidylglycerophosphate/cardiolipin synthase-like enzyme